MMHTPWGESQTEHMLAPGILRVTTASHGGVRISAARRATMPEEYRRIPTFAGGNWYEEDCDWCIVALSFPEAFAAQVSRDAAAEMFEWLRQNSDRIR